MARNQVVLFLIFILINSNYLFSQGTFVEYLHPVYKFLERMEAKGFIENFADEVKPISRIKIANFLSILYDKRFVLEDNERKFLDYYLDEFSYEIFSNLNRYEILIGKHKFNLTSKKPKFLYAYAEPKKFSFFLKSYFSGFYFAKSKSRNAKFLEEGGKFYGNIIDLIGFEFDAKNGIVTGDKEVLKFYKEIRYNFKLYEKPESKFFDRSFGYLSLEFPYFYFKIGKDRNTIGYGRDKLILSDNSRDFGRFEFHFNYKSLSFDYFHGWLKLTPLDPISVSYQYMAHHRIAFSPSKNLKLGFGESVVYSRQSISIDYLNPFNFFKNVEHQTKDQDNALMYFDVEALPLKNFKLYSTFLIDDIDFEKIGKNWYGNKTAFQLGLSHFSNFFSYPVTLTIEYKKIEPYTYTHHLPERKYAIDDLPLGAEQPPNSYRFDFGLDLYPTPEFQLEINYSFTKWGSNYLDENGTFINVGGDINVYRRSFDSEYVKFLDGKRVRMHLLEISLFYEFIRNIKFQSKLNYSITSENASTLIFNIGLISFL